MPRRPRIQLDRVPLQIVQRGHNREACASIPVDVKIDPSMVMIIYMVLFSDD